MTLGKFVEPDTLEAAVIDKLKEKGINYNCYPLDPYQLIEDEGIICQEDSFDDINIRGMLFNLPNASGILINSNRCINSKRFIATHELMHYWFHPKFAKIVCIESYREDRKGREWQANHAAACALMPSYLMHDIFNCCGGNIDYMSNFFNVTREAMLNRMKSLNMIQLKVENDIVFNAQYIDKTLMGLESSWLYGGI